jgi:hypothetical protein
MGEVLDWFEEDGFDFINGVPRPYVWEPFLPTDRLFEPSAPGSALDRGFAQAKMVVTGNQEGGFYIMIGRKRS